MKAYELLSSKDRWCKKYSAILKDGSPAFSIIELRNCPEKFKCFCLIGALYFCYTNMFDYAEAVNKIYRLLPNGHGSIAEYNDDPNTTYEDIIKLLKEADL